VTPSPPRPIPAGLDGISASGLFTLGARALETKRPDALLRDPIAVDLVERLEWGFGAYAEDWMTQLTVAIRTEILDEGTRDFIRRHPLARVVNLGAGFCARGLRLAASGLDWIDLDFDRVIALKRTLLPERSGYRYVASSILDPAWIERLAHEPERPTLFLAEGVLQYLPRRDVERLLGEITRRFPASEMLLEVISPLAVAIASCSPTLTRAGLRPRWGLRSMRMLERWAPNARVTASWFYDRHLERWGWVRGIAWLPPIRGLMRVVKLEWNAPTDATP
jgi:methyltransferase (TIGR00027 family)